MPVFDTQSLTPEQKAVAYVVRSRSAFSIFYEGLLRKFKSDFDAFWYSTDYTPQQAADAWGTDALELFMKSAATRDYLLALVPYCLEGAYISTPQPVTPEIENGVPTGRVIIG